MGTPSSGNCWKENVALVPQTEVTLSRWRQFAAHPAALLLAQFVVFALVYATVAFAMAMTGRAYPGLQPVAALLGAAAGWWLYRALVRAVERREAQELSLPGSVTELVIGLGLGFALFSGVTCVVAALGGFVVQDVRGLGNLSDMLAIAILTAFYEELIFRGIAMRHLEGMIGSIGALAVTSAFFGLAHLANPESSLFAAMAIAVEAGILLGAAWLLTRRLWLAMGIHAAWNFTQGWLFSIPISGTGPSDGLLITMRQGPDWLTGGAFGLEASVVALIIASAAGLAMLHRAGQRRQIRGRSKAYTKL